MNRSRTARLLVLVGTVVLFATCSRQKTGSESQQGSPRPGSPAVDIAARQENNLVVVTEDASLLEALKDRQHQVERSGEFWPGGADPHEIL